jgi:tRNA threonylcarbamoyl adenosine modification protein YeaZ
VRQLVIDTASESLSVALFTDSALMAFHHEITGRGHAEKLIPAIATFPDGGKADEIIVDTGPGSFTGVRVGIAAARALGYAWDVAVKGYVSLSLVAAIARDSNAGNEPITVAITGGHGELFWQMFDGETLAPLSEVTSTPIAELAARVDASIVYGSGAQALIEARGSGQAIPIEADARAFPLIPNVYVRHAVSPVYGRGADARPAGAQA